MISLVQVSALLTLFVAGAAAHGGVTSYDIDGTAYVGWSPYNPADSQSSIERPYSTYDPILSATAATIHCNDDGSASASQLSATVAAGSSITAYWNQWTHREGPVMVYLASCGGACSSANSASLEWFKIAETGLKSGTLGAGEWGNGDIVDTLEYTTSIPSSLASGEYLIRHELLALHQANTPQFYPECAQLIITGSGSATPSAEYLISLPGGYSQSDPGILVDIYSEAAQTETTYTPPGPAVWSG